MYAIPDLAIQDPYWQVWHTYEKIKKFDEPKNLAVYSFCTKKLSYQRQKKRDYRRWKQLRRYIFRWPVRQNTIGGEN
jgi:hypothetical protein